MALSTFKPLGLHFVYGGLVLALTVSKSCAWVCLGASTAAVLICMVGGMWVARIILIFIFSIILIILVIVTVFISGFTHIKIDINDV